MLKPLRNRGGREITKQIYTTSPFSAKPPAGAQPHPSLCPFPNSTRILFLYNINFTAVILGLTIFTTALSGGERRGKLHRHLFVHKSYIKTLSTINVKEGEMAHLGPNVTNYTIVQYNEMSKIFGDV